MNKTNNPKLTSNAQTLRANMTPEERRLWYDFLKHLSVTVNRQKVIGQYIVDFYCADAELVIELDGSQHFTPEGKAHDKERDTYLNGLGLTVLRFSNQDIIHRFDGVCKQIQKYILTSNKIKNPP